MFLAILLVAGSQDSAISEQKIKEIRAKVELEFKVARAHVDFFEKEEAIRSARARARKLLSDLKGEPASCCGLGPASRDILAVESRTG